ncbi:hypothetical protein OC25_09045 [Pedobacter kyungheensis]|uniref:Uncharacterized protein n=1 Tax=Pedobacter kyungheensis TaxID=1069985 RepID=A0A0C1G3R9_9SPHI|nr:hypothetical protein OC25_09045 [Pedobacter kyungheensis]
MQDLICLFKPKGIFTAIRAIIKSLKQKEERPKQVYPVLVFMSFILIMNPLAINLAQTVIASLIR